MGAYKPAVFSGKTMLIHSYLILESQICKPENYDIFDTCVTELVKDQLSDPGTEFLCSKDVFDEVDRGFSNTFKYFKGCENRKIFLYAKIISNKAREVVIRIESSKNTKFWLNQHCLSIHNGFWAENFYVKVRLNIGENIFLVEKFSPQTTDIMSVQILDYAFEMSSNFRALSNTGKNFVIDSLVLRDNEKYVPNAPVYQFLYLACDESLFHKIYKIEVLDEVDGSLDISFVKLNRVFNLALNQIRTQVSDKTMHIIIRCTFISLDKGEIIKEHKIVIKSFDQRYAHTVTNLERRIDCCDEPARNQIGGCIALLKKLVGYQDYVGLYFNMLACELLINKIDKNQFNPDFYNKSGDHIFYIRSKLDQSYVQMKARIPDGYDKNKRYPVIFMLLTGYGEYFSDWLELDLLAEPVLCFDVPGRGYTGGSYIGEASTMEIIEWVKEHYLIDDNRIYIVGQSNGGFASYSIAQNHPSLPAAIFPMISYPNIDQIRNLSNIPTFQVVSPKDYVFHGRENQVQSLLTKYGKYHQYNFKEMLHAYFRQYIAHRVLLKQIVGIKRDPYPDTVRFKTYRNRHLQSDYLKINGIRPEFESASIFCRIVDPTTITIYAEGTDSFSIELPPQINRDKFNLFVNGKQFVFDKIAKDKLIFVKGKRWKTARSEPEINYRKGTGLLDVYLDTLHIVVPQNEADAAVLKIAENFSRPVTNGFFPEVEVNYPVITDLEVSPNIAEKNMIVIDVNQTSRTASCLKQYLKVDYDQLGYETDGEKTLGEYVLMQVIANPKNPKCSILIISTNNTALLLKHILLRKVVLPTYCYGLHPMWNKEILLFDGKIYVRSNEIEKEKQ